MALRPSALVATATLLLAATGCFGGSTNGANPEGGTLPTYDGSFPGDSGPPADAHPTQDAEAGPASSAKLAAATSAGAATADFGTVQVGQTSAAASIVVSNPGTSATGTLAVKLTGADLASFAIDSDACSGKTLAPSTTCAVAVHFDPTAAGSLSASLAIDATPGGSVAVALTGKGVSAGALSLTPPSQDFGPVTTQTSSPTTTFTVTNTGGTATAALAASVTGTDKADFPLSQNGCNAPLAAGASCTVDVAFDPAAAGPRAASLAVTDGTSTATSSLAGTGVGPAAFTIAPATFDFGKVTVKLPSPPQSFTLTNSGGDASGVPALAASGTLSADFAVDPGSCTAALQGGASCTFSVVFTPSSTTAPESVSVNATAASTTAGSAALTGTGITAAGLAVAPATGFSGNFGNVELGHTATGAMTLTNNGQTPTSVAPSLTVGNLDYFSLSAGTPPCNAVLAGGASCGFVVTFAPGTNLGEVGGAITATAGSLTGNYEVYGTGAQAVLAIAAPPAWTGFGNVEVDATAKATFTVTNTGAITSDAAPVVKSSNTDFTISAGTTPCTGALAPNASCNFVLTFAPTAASTSDSTTLTATVTGGAAATPYTASGSASAPTLQVTGTPFGYVTMGTSSALTYQVKNAGPFPSAAPTLTSSNPDFVPSVASTTPCTGTLAVNASCNVVITFKPSTFTAQESAVITAAVAPDNSGTYTATGQGGVGVLDTLNAWSAQPTAQGVTSPTTNTYTITNSGHGATNALAITGITATSAPFHTQADTCSNVSLPATTGKCTFQVVFAPTTASAPAIVAQTTVVVTDTTNDTTVAVLSGLVLSPTPYIVLSPSPYNYGTNLAPGQYQQVFSGRNYSTVSAPLNHLGPVNISERFFNVSPTNNTCTTTLGAYGSGTDTCSGTGVLFVEAGITSAFPAAAGVIAMDANDDFLGPLDVLSASW